MQCDLLRAGLRPTEATALHRGSVDVLCSGPSDRGSSYADWISRAIYAIAIPAAVHACFSC